MHIPQIARPVQPNPHYKSVDPMPIIVHRYRLVDNAPASQMGVEGIMLEKHEGEIEHWLYSAKVIDKLNAHIKTAENPEGIVEHQIYNTQTYAVIEG